MNQNDSRTRMALMDLNTLKKFAQGMRRDLVSQMDARIEYVLNHDDEYLRAHQSEKKKIVELEKAKGRLELAEEAAYLWFNRLAAFRFMDSRGYTNPRLVSPRKDESQPELLAEIKQGIVPVELASYKPQFDAILSGRIKTIQPDREVYKEALLGTCNAWASRMPWLFTKVDDWASLLLPQDLLSKDSLVARMVAGLSDEDCAEGVEIIGWLYQFYISEKKDEVFALLKKNVKIAKENIPAATQLFTPHWIVRFMVENSLGRLWLLNRPESRLKERMKYFVESDPEPDYLKVKDPTELKCLDPCCGSGHILAYFFELLYAIYEEEGYAPAEIPSLIIQKNIYGIDIDERAAELAAFTLAMVAREKDKRFFERGIQPNVIAMRDANVNLKKLGVRLSPDLQESVELLKEGRNYGSLIPVPAGAAGEIHEVEAGIESHRFDDLFGAAELEELRVAFRILEYLEPRYHVVVTNPPYAGSGNLAVECRTLFDRYFKIERSDLYAFFIEKNFTMVLERGYSAMVTRNDWLTTKSFQHIRELAVSKEVPLILDLGPDAFPEIKGEVVQTCSFITRRSSIPRRTLFIDASKHPGSQEGIFPIINEGIAISLHAFDSMPHRSFCYKLIGKVKPGNELGQFGTVREGIHTANNGRYVKLWWEIAYSKFGEQIPDLKNLDDSGKKWIPYNKGGQPYKWFGNNIQVIAFDKKSRNEMSELKGHVRPSKELYFKPGLTWSDVGRIGFCVKYYPQGFLFDGAGPVIVSTQLTRLAASLNNKAIRYIADTMMPNLHYKSGTVSKLPIEPLVHQKSLEIAQRAISVAKSDWDLREVSWDFVRCPLLNNYLATRTEQEIDKTFLRFRWEGAFVHGKNVDLSFQYKSFKNYWGKQFIELHKDEEENNQIFIALYGLETELTPEIAYTEITILQDELIESARKEGIIEFDDNAMAHQLISYGIGCLFGRYSVEMDGLILADVGATIDDFRKILSNAHFLPDDDGIIPFTDEDDFPDDLPTAFKSWLRFISGAHYADNLHWIEECLGKDLRSFFDKDFYKDHVKRYKFRPIYWMVSSPSGAFRALIYLHRYSKDTVGKILNDYVRPYRTKIDQKIRRFESIIDSSVSSAGEKVKGKKRLAQLEKYRTEIETWEKESLYPLALKRVELDLDDGVKVNYRKLEGILEPVKQLEGKEEE
jgi:SAM-dependent methyltransferase